MKTSVEVDSVSLTTVQGYLSLASKFLIVSAGGLGASGYLKTAAAFGLLLILVGGAQAAIGQVQQDATKPLDSQGKPLPSSETPIAPSVTLETK